MKEIKGYEQAAIPTAAEEELARINALSPAPLTAEEVYVFALHLCDNEVDRDYERFDIPALKRLGELFVGRTGLFDHSWSARDQSARIFRTEVRTDESLTTSAGEPYTWLKGYAYMVRTEANRDLIREIQGGIKKEVSIACRVRETVCSICGESLYDAEKCTHRKGHWYQNRQCCGILRDPLDAYEWSFVAVPAQPQAGVVKGFRPGEGVTLKELVRDRPDLLAELETLAADGALGRRYRKELQAEVARLGGLLDAGSDAEMRLRMAEKLDGEELLALKGRLEARLAEKYPPVSQLWHRNAERQREETGADGDFMI